MGEMRCLMLVAHFINSSISSYLAFLSFESSCHFCFRLDKTDLRCFLSNLSSLVLCAAWKTFLCKNHCCCPKSLVAIHRKYQFCKKTKRCYCYKKQLYICYFAKKKTIGKVFSSKVPQNNRASAALSYFSLERMVACTWPRRGDQKCPFFPKKWRPSKDCKEKVGSTSLGVTGAKFPAIQNRRDEFSNANSIAFQSKASGRCINLFQNSGFLNGTSVQDPTRSVSTSSAVHFEDISSNPSINPGS